jgi:hypothetical protein
MYDPVITFTPDSSMILNNYRYVQNGVEKRVLKLLNI